MTSSTPPPSVPPGRARPRRSRARTWLPAAVALWLVLEIWLLTLIAGAAGGWAVFLLLVAGAVAGGAVIRLAGRRALRNLSQTLGQTTPGTGPDGRQTDPAKGGVRRGGGFLVLAGVLLAFPGPLTDVAGLLLLLPPVRHGVQRRTERAVERRLRAAVPPEWADAFARGRQQGGDGRVVPGEVVRDDPPSDDDGHGDDSGPRPPLTG